MCSNLNRGMTTCSYLFCVWDCKFKLDTHPVSFDHNWKPSEAILRCVHRQGEKTDNCTAKKLQWEEVKRKYCAKTAQIAVSNGLKMLNKISYTSYINEAQTNKFYWTWSRKEFTIHVRAKTKPQSLRKSQQTSKVGKYPDEGMNKCTIALRFSGSISVKLMMFGTKTFPGVDHQLNSSR